MSDNQITKTISFKLKLDNSIIEDLDAYFVEFAKAVNFFLRKMHYIRNCFENIPKNKQRNAKCQCCRNNTNLIKKNISKFTFQFPLGEKTVNKTNKNNSLLFSAKTYQIKPQNEICSYCYGFVCGDKFIRKQMYPNRSKKWFVLNEFNVENAASLSGTEFAMAFEQAKAILKSRKEQERTWKRQKYFLERKLQRLIEVKDDKEIEIEPENGEVIKVKARITIPKKNKRSEDHFKHCLDNEKYEGKTMYSLNKSIEGLQKTIETLKKRSTTFPYFNGKVIILHQNSLKFLDNNNLRLNFGKKRYNIGFYSTDVKNLKGRTWFATALENIKKHPITYVHVVKRVGEFFLEYPTKVDISIPSFDGSFKALGIDRGVKNIIVMCILNHKNGKPYNIKFVSGEELWKTRIKYRSIAKSLTNIPRKNRELKMFRGKVRNVSKNLVQNTSRKVVEIAKQNKPIVIVLEKLKGLKEQKRPRRYSKKVEKRINYKISTFIYGQIQKAIEYKAKEDGIPIKYVEAENTSKMCSRPGCSNIDSNNRKSQANFKCTKCNYQMNADLNAAINIANAFYKDLNIP